MAFYSPSFAAAGGASAEAKRQSLAGGKKSLPGQPWSDLETRNLIDAYEERWHTQKRGQLKAAQWDELAADVATRCGISESGAKTGTQCRHKIEKLRKRYRAERARPVTSLWPFFSRMDRLERGSLPASTRSGPPPPAPPSFGFSDEDEEDEGEEEEEEEEDRIQANTRSINGIIREKAINGGSKSRRPEMEDEEEDDEEGNGEGIASMMAKLVRGFGEGFMRMEKRRMGMMKEMERERMEAETRRAELMMESTRQVIESIASVFSGTSPASKKAKKAATVAMENSSLR